MTCADVINRLTAYADGELDDAAGSAMRGHLRTCAGCRVAAENELAVRDAMGKLSAPDVPAGLWTGIAARLAEREVADSKRSRWWLWWQVARPRLVPAVLIAAATVIVVAAWIRHRGSTDTPPQVAHEIVPPAPAPLPIAPVIHPSVGLDCDLHTDSSADVTTALAGMSASIDRCYQAAADELLAIVAEDRPGWTARRAQTFDSELDSARHAVTTAGAGRPRERAWQAEIQLLQRAVTVPLLAEAGP